MAKSDELGTKINLAEARKEASHDWIISILEVEKRSIPSSQKKLQKVPRQLREKEENKGYFDPRVVSIGPYHHGKPGLEEAEKLKTRAVCAFMNGEKKGKKKKVELHEINNRMLQVVNNKMLQVVSDARKCYIDGSTDDYDDVEFARMMLLDGCFILQFIYDIKNEGGPLLDELMKHVGHAGYRGIIVDIILLENQLPFLVLQALISSSSTREGQWEQLIENFIVQIYIDKRATWRLQTYKHIPLHLLDLLRRRLLGISPYSPTEEQGEEEDRCIIPYSRTEEQGEEDDGYISAFPPTEERRELDYFFRSDQIHQYERKGHPFEDAYSHSFRSATELKARGIHFRPSTTFYLNDFTFTSRFGYGLLTLPQVSFGHKFRYCILNMMAYELAPSEKIKHPAVCCYIYFMNSLINGVEDVIELRSNNIIHIFYGTDEQVAKAFNSMATVGAYVSYKGPIKEVSDQIQKHYNSRMKTWTAQLLHNYFSNPWSAVAFFAATFALVLTFIQTFFPRQ